MQSYIESIQKQFAYYQDLGEKAIAQLTDKELHYAHNEASNSVAVMVKHIAGNMLSRWTNFYEEDGEKEWRYRDTEFEDTYANREELIAHWHQGWDCLKKVTNELRNKDLERIVYIRNMGHTVVEATNRQLSHYCYHIGQIVFAAKMIKGNDWQNLSVAKNQSTKYNQEKFNKEKGKRHFTDDL